MIAPSSDTIKILNDDDALELFKRTPPSASGATFIQAAVGEHAMKCFTIPGAAAVCGEGVRVPCGHAVEVRYIVEVKNDELFNVNSHEPSEVCRSSGGVQAPHVQTYALNHDSSFRFLLSR